MAIRKDKIIRYALSRRMKKERNYLLSDIQKKLLDMHASLEKETPYLNVKIFMLEKNMEELQEMIYDVTNCFHRKSETQPRISLFMKDEYCEELSEGE